MASQFGDALVDHHTYVMASDGDLMEGISHEAISIAGHLRLNKLIVFFDNNSISIDGPLCLAETGDQVARFMAAGWNATHIDGHNPDEIARAIEAAQKSDKPSMIACKTIIGYGVPTKAGTQKAHSDAPGDEEIAGARKALHWDSPPFVIPADIRDAWRIAGLKSSQARKEWEKRLAAADSNTRGEFERRMRGDLPPGFDDAMTDATRRRSPRSKPQGRDPQGLRDGARRHQRGRPGDDRRLRRPDAVQQHPHQGHEGHQARRLSPAATCIGACASTAWPPP